MDTKTNTPLDGLIDRAQMLSRCRAQLAELVRSLQLGIDALKADSLPNIRLYIDAASGAWSALEASVQAHPELFVKPRTVSAHGIVFGLAKGRGGLEIDDEDRTVALIKKHLADQADVLIATRERPVKDALLQLPAADLKRIGVNVRETGDRVVIKPADGDVDKLVKALVTEAVKGDEP